MRNAALRSPFPVCGVALATLFAGLVSACADVPLIPPGSPLAIAPMTLVQKNVDPPAKLVELRADGAVVGANGALLGKIQGNKVVDETGKEVITIAPDGAVKIAESTRAFRFSSEGELSDPKGTLKIGTDGTVITVEPNGDITRLPIRFESYSPERRRTGEVIIILTSKHLGKVAEFDMD